MALPAIADIYSVTSQEQSKMLDEADDWIDDMPDGIQDKISDAVVHSLRGFYSELNYFRTQVLSDTSSFSNVGTRSFNTKDSRVKIRYYSSVKKGGSKTEKSLLVYFHGGGWTLGSINASDKFCRALASKGDVEIASIDYPLAPENDYSDIISKCAEAVKYISQVFPGKSISLGGDGAGGNLAVSSFYLLKRMDPKLKIKSLILFYPLLSVNMDNASDAWHRYSRGYGLDGRVMEAFSQAYGVPSHSSDYVTSVNSIPDSQIKELPPILLVMSGRDIIIDDNREFAKRLKRCGVKCQSVEFSGAIHGFITDKNQNTAFTKAVDFTNLFINQLVR